MLRRDVHTRFGNGYNDEGSCFVLLFGHVPWLKHQKRIGLSAR